MLQTSTLTSYFGKIREDGWYASKNGENDERTWWKAEYRGSEVKWDVYIILEKRWVYFQLPFLNLSVTKDCQAALHKFLLKLNDQIFLAKFTIDKRNQIVLMIELPARTFDFTQFNDTLKTLVTIADEFRNELNILRKNSRVAEIINSIGS